MRSSKPVSLSLSGFFLALPDINRGSGKDDPLAESDRLSDGTVRTVPGAHAETYPQKWVGLLCVAITAKWVRLPWRKLGRGSRPPVSKSPCC